MVEKDFYIFKINPTTITGVSREESSIYYLKTNAIEKLNIRNKYPSWFDIYLVNKLGK